MGLPTVVRACDVPCCLAEASAPSHPCSGLGVELSALNTFVGTAGNALSEGAPRLEPRPLGLTSLRGFAGSAALGRP